MSEIASEVATVGLETSESGPLEVAANPEEVTSGEIETEPVHVSFKLGAHIYSCLASTILKHKETVLAKSLTDTRCSISEVIEIERDGTFFPAILDYMRDDKLDLDWFSEPQVDALREEADFYGLTGLIDLCDYHYYTKVHHRKKLASLGVGGCAIALSTALIELWMAELQKPPQPICTGFNDWKNCLSLLRETLFGLLSL